MVYDTVGKYNPHPQWESFYGGLVNGYFKVFFLSLTAGEWKNGSHWATIHNLAMTWCLRNWTCPLNMVIEEAKNFGYTNGCGWNLHNLKYKFY